MKQSSLQLIKWPQVIALLLLDFAVIISWIAYHEFQPKVLEQFGLLDFIVEFMILQGLIIVITPAIAGRIADKKRDEHGDKFGIINIGVNVVSMIFMAVALTVFLDPQGPVKWVLPLLIVGWLISMNLFRSPAMSLIESLVPQEHLTKVLAIFILFFDLAYALEPSIVDLLNFLGGPATFVVGGILVFTTGMYLQKTYKKLSPDAVFEHKEFFDNDTEDGKSNFLYVVLVSLGLGLATMFIFKQLPGVYELKLPDIIETVGNGNFFISIVIAISAVFSFAFGFFGNFKKIYLINLLSFLVLSASIVGLYFSNSVAITLLLTLVMIITFSLVSITALPIAFYRLSSSQTIFGIGLFYGLAEFADSFWEVIEVL